MNALFSDLLSKAVNKHSFDPKPKAIWHSYMVILNFGNQHYLRAKKAINSLK